MTLPRPTLKPTTGFRPSTPCPACGLKDVAAVCEPCLGRRRRTRLNLTGPPEMWLEVPLGGGWLAAYRLAAGDDGRPIIAELRVFPNEKKRPGPGRWTAERIGADAPVPPGGVTASLLRRLRPDTDLREHFSAIVAAYSKELTEDLNTAGLETAAAIDGPRRGPKGHGELFYARVARDYARLCDRGEANPTAKLVGMRKYHGYTPANLRDYVHRARAHGLLTSALAAGKPGGALTQKAKAILARGKD